MPRTDRRGRDLKQFLQAEILGKDVTYEELCEALRVTKARYYRRGETCGRADADDFPNTEELRHVTDYYQLGDDGYLNLLVEFDWIDARPETPGYTHPFATPGATLTQQRPRVKSRREQQQQTALGRPSL